MTTQPEALRLADALDRMSLSTKWDKQAAAELRRLHEVNQGLLEALKGMVQLDEEEHQRGPGDIDICKEVQDACAAIAKATGESK